MSRWADSAEDAGDHSHAPAHAAAPAQAHAHAHGDDSHGHAPHAQERPQAEFPSQPPYSAFFGNLSFDTNEADLEHLLGSLQIEKIRLISDRETGRPKGIAYVDFADADSLRQALTLNQTEFMHRTIRVDVAGEKRGGRGGGGGGGGDRPRNNRDRDRGDRGGDRDRDRRGPREEQDPSSFGARGFRPVRVVESPQDLEPDPEELKRRVKITIAPRSAAPAAAAAAAPAPAAAAAAAAPAAGSPAGAAPKKASPFGAARPREEVIALRKAKGEAVIEESDAGNSGARPAPKHANPNPAAAAAAAAPAAAAAGPAADKGARGGRGSQDPRNQKEKDTGFARVSHGRKGGVSRPEDDNGPARVDNAFAALNTDE